MPPPINPLNPPQQDERNLRKLVTEGFAPGTDLTLGNVLRRGGKRGPAGAQAVFRGRIRPDQPGLRYNLLLIDDAERGGQPRYVNLDTLRYVLAQNRMSRPWGDPEASHNTIPREERRYAKDATYTTSGGNTGVRHFYPPGYGPLDDEDAPESRQSKPPISELRGPAGRDRFVRWLTGGGVGTRTRDFSEDTMDGLGVQFFAPDRGLLNDGGKWSRGRFMPKGAAGRLRDTLGISAIPTQGFSMTGGAADRSVGAVNHFMPGRRQQFELGGEQQFGIRSIPPTADAYISRLRSWTGRMPGGEHTNRELHPLSHVEPPDMNVHGEELDAASHPSNPNDFWTGDQLLGIAGGKKINLDLARSAQMLTRLKRVPWGGLDYDPEEMSSRVPTDAEKREIVGEGIWDIRRAMGGSENLYGTGGKLQDYEVERLLKGNANLSRHALKYPNYPAQQEVRVNVPGSGNDLRTKLLEMELNDPSVTAFPGEIIGHVKQGEPPIQELADLLDPKRLWAGRSHQSRAINGLNDRLERNIARHRFSLGQQDFAIQPRPQLGALGNAQLVPIYLPQGNAPAVGVTPTGGYAPPPRNAALVPQRRFALGEEEMGGGMMGLGAGDQQFRVGDRPNYLENPQVRGGRSVFPQGRSYGTSSTDYDPAGKADALNTAQFPLGDRIKSRAIGQIAPIKPSHQPDEMARQLNRAALPRDRYGNVARQGGGERSWGDWWQGLNNGLEDWLDGIGGQRLKGGVIAGAGAGLVAGGLPGALLGGGLGALGGAAKGVYDYMRQPRTGLNPQRVSGAAYSPSDRAFMRSVRRTPQFALGSQDFSREDDFGDLLAQLGLGSDVPPVADEPLVVLPQTPEEMMRARATINTAHGPRDLYDMDPEKISGYLRGQGLMTSGKSTQKRLRAVYGASGRISPERAQQILSGPHESGVAGRVAEITGDLPHQQAPSESPEQRRRRMSGRELGFALGEQDFGLWDTIKHVASQANPVASYRNLRSAGHGRLASGAMVGGGLLGDAMLTGFHPPLVSIGLGRYAQRKAQAADRASDERRAEWMRG